MGSKPLSQGPKVLGYMLELKAANEFAAGMDKAGRSLKTTTSDATRATTEVRKMGTAAKAEGSAVAGMFGKIATVAAPLLTGAVLRQAWVGAMEDLEAAGKVGTRLAPGIKAAEVFGDRIDSIARSAGTADDILWAATGDALQMQVGQADVMDLVERSAKNAAGTYQDVRSEIAGTMAIVNNYGESVKNAQDIQNALWIGVKYGAEDVGTLAGALEAASAGASTLGMGYEELIALNSVLAKAGLKGTRGIQAVAATLAGVTDASPDALAEAKRLGIEWDADSLRARGFAGWIEHVTGRLAVATAAGNNTAQSMKLLGLNAKSMGAFSLLTRDADGYRKILDEIRDGEDELSKRWEQRQEGMDFKAQQFSVNKAQVFDALGAGLVAGLTGANVAMTDADFVKALDRLKIAGETLGEAGKRLLELAGSKPLGDEGPSGIELAAGVAAGSYALPKVWRGGKWVAQTVPKVPGAAGDAARWLAGNAGQVVEHAGEAGTDAFGTTWRTVEGATPNAFRRGMNAVGRNGPRFANISGMGIAGAGELSFVAQDVYGAIAEGFVEDTPEKAALRAQTGEIMKTMAQGMTTSDAQREAQRVGQIAAVGIFNAFRDTTYSLEEALKGQSIQEGDREGVLVHVAIDHVITDKGPKAKDRGHKAAAKVAGAGDGQGTGFSNYRFFMRREGAGIDAVAPLPMNVRDAYTRPSE